MSVRRFMSKTHCWTTWRIRWIPLIITNVDRVPPTLNVYQPSHGDGDDGISGRYQILNYDKWVYGSVSTVESQAQQWMRWKFAYIILDMYIWRRRDRLLWSGLSASDIFPRGGWRKFNNTWLFECKHLLPRMGF